VYLLNSGTNDVSTAINAYAIMELNYKGAVFTLRQVLIRCKVQSAGDLTVTPYVNAIAQTAKTLSMTAAVTNQTLRRHLFNLNLTGDWLSLKIAHNTVSESMLLVDIGVMEVIEPER
jgi:hypothetical protein